MEETNHRNKIDSEKNLHSLGQNLSFQDLKSVPEDIFQLKHLTMLYLNNNLITELPNDIKNLKNLFLLNVSHNKLEKLPQSLSEISKLKYLNVSYNKLSEIPPVLLESLQFLRALILSHNEIKYFTDPPSCLNNLVELNVSYNKLMKIPNWIFSVKCKLKILDISNNELSCMNENFLSGNVLIKLVTKIDSLNLQNCGLTSERLHFISNMTALEYLNLGSNNNEFSKSKNFLDNLNFEVLEKCINLKEIHLNYVDISILSNNLDCFKRLRHIDLEGNFLTWLPNSFCELHSLEICNLSRNTISFLPEKFGKLANLKYLYLNNNNISGIPKSFNLLENLEYCDFYTNILENISLSIFSLKSLKGIDFENNCIDFKALCGDEETYNQIISKYSVLKERYRSIMGMERCDLQILENNDRIQGDDEQHSGTSSDESNTLLNVMVEKEFVSLENWDEDWNGNIKNISSDLEHDDFDPNVNYDLTFKRKKKNTRNNFYSNFCPADIHIPSLRKYFIRKPQDAVVEGQYDLN